MSDNSSMSVSMAGNTACNALPNADLEGALVTTECVQGPHRMVLEWTPNGTAALVGMDFEPSPSRVRAAQCYIRALRGSPQFKGQAILEFADDVVRLASESGPVPIPQPAEFDPSPPSAFDPASWQAREPLAAWRGPLAGEAEDLRAVMRLPRLQLCLAGRFSPNLNARLTGLGAFATFGVPLQEALGGLDLLARAAETPPATNRYVLEVQGAPTDTGRLTLEVAGRCWIRVGPRQPLWFDFLAGAADAAVCVTDPRQVPNCIRELESSGQGREAAAAAAAFFERKTADLAGQTWRSLVIGG